MCREGQRRESPRGGPFSHTHLGPEELWATEDRRRRKFKANGVVSVSAAKKSPRRTEKSPQTEQLTSAPGFCPCLMSAEASR